MSMHNIQEYSAARAALRCEMLCQCVIKEAALSRAQAELNTATSRRLGELWGERHDITTGLLGVLFLSWAILMLLVLVNASLNMSGSQFAYLTSLAVNVAMFFVLTAKVIADHKSRAYLAEATDNASAANYLSAIEQTPEFLIATVDMLGAVDGTKLLERGRHFGLRMTAARSVSELIQRCSHMMLMSGYSVADFRAWRAVASNVGPLHE